MLALFWLTRSLLLCAGFLSGCEEWGCSLLWCVGFSLQGLPLLQSTASRRQGFGSCSKQTQWPGIQASPRHIMWNLPGLGIKPGSPVLAGRFLSTAPRGKCSFTSFYLLVSLPSLCWVVPWLNVYAAECGVPFLIHADGSVPRTCLFAKSLLRLAVGISWILEYLGLVQCRIVKDSIF